VPEWQDVAVGDEVKVTTLDHQRVVPMSPPLPATLHGQACANTSDRPHALTLAESHSLHRV
jgi:hypothetical protein